MGMQNSTLLSNVKSFVETLFRTGLIEPNIICTTGYEVFRKRVYRTGTDGMKVLPLSLVVAKDQLPGDYHNTLPEICYG